MDIGKILGIAIGQPVEARYDDAWYHATVLGLPRKILVSEAVT